MEEESILDPLNELHLMGLHFVYVPLVNKKLNLWQSAWAHHRMRTTWLTPAQMWLTGQINHPMGLDLTSIPLQDCEDSEDELGGNEEQLIAGRSSCISSTGLPKVAFVKVVETLLVSGITLVVEVSSSSSDSNPSVQDHKWSRSLRTRISWLHM